MADGWGWRTALVTAGDRAGPPCQTPSDGADGEWTPLTNRSAQRPDNTRIRTELDVPRPSAGLGYSSVQMSLR